MEKLTVMGHTHIIKKVERDRRFVNIPKPNYHGIKNAVLVGVLQKGQSYSQFVSRYNNKTRKHETKSR